MVFNCINIEFKVNIMPIIVKDNQSSIEIKNEIISLTFYKMGRNQGTFEILHKNQICLKSCYSLINILSENFESIQEISSKDHDFAHQIKQVKDIIGNGLKLTLIPKVTERTKIKFSINFRIYENQDFVLIKIKDIVVIDNKSQYRIHSISPLTIKNEKLWLSGRKIPTDLERISWFKNGWQSWSPCELIYGTEEDNEGPSLDIFKRTFDNQDYKIKGRFYSEYCTVITDLQSRNSLILGFVTLNTQFTRILLDYKEREVIAVLTSFGCMDGIQFENSSVGFSEELYVCFKNDNLGYNGLIEYAKLVKLDQNLESTIPIGWCSWYYYFTNVSEDDLIKNLNFFKNNKNAILIDFFQLDDGYFTHIGDFNDINSKFPNGLLFLFNRINESGFKGGIWTAPFFAEKKSKLFKQHRDWFLKHRDTNKMLKVHFGASWNAYLYGLDLSNPQVLDYLSNFYKNLKVFNNASQSISSDLISFYKIDFLHAAVPIEGKFFNPNLTRAQILYNGVKAIRDAINKDDFLLACGAPLGPCVGLVNAMRIGEDTSPRWEEKNQQLLESGIYTPGLKVSLINTIYRSFMHKNFWINDPDCLMIRRNDTELTKEEIKLQLTVIGLSGGQVLISDDMTILSDEEINDAKLLIPPYNPSNYDAVAADAFISKLPTIYMLKTNEIIGKRYLVAIINWEDFPINKRISINEINIKEKDENSFIVFDYWNKKIVGIYHASQIIELGNIAPHSCKYFSIIPYIKNKPILLSTSLHITQGCLEIRHYEFNESENRILIDISLNGKRKGNVYLKVHSGMQITECNCDFYLIDEKENIWEIYLEFENKKSIKIQLS